jgi:NADH-quinone oxidoreductase subunit I
VRPDGNPRSVAGFGVTFRTMFRKTFTIDYPNGLGHRAALPRSASAEPLAGRLEKVCRLRAVCLGLSRRRDLRRGRAEHRGGRYSPGERYGRVYQINYLRCILCGLCIEACPTGP